MQIFLVLFCFVVGEQWFGRFFFESWRVITKIHKGFLEKTLFFSSVVGEPSRFFLLVIFLFVVGRSRGGVLSFSCSNELRESLKRS